MTACQTVAYRFRQLANQLQQLASRSPLLVRMAVKIRNQAEAVMGYSLASGADPESNGENLLMSLMRGRIDTLLDVGANVGDWSDHVLRDIAPAARGLLFEPNPVAAGRLRARFGGNPRIEVIEAAVSDQAGRVRFFQEAGCGVTSSLVPGASNVEAAVIDVESVTLDEVLLQRKWPSVDFLKIDAEGHDDNVLRGARSLLERRAIRCLQFEYGASWAPNGSTLAKTIRFLEGFGYVVRAITRKGPIPYSYPEFREFFRYCNFAAAPREEWAGILGDAGI